MVDRLFDAIANIAERVLAIAFVATVVLNFANVVDRYILNESILSADEIQIYTMIWITFLGAVVVTWRRRHLRMDVLLLALPAPLQKLQRFVELVLLAGLGGFMLVNSCDYTASMYAIGRTSDSAGIPLWTIHATLPIGFGLMAAVSMWRLLAWRRGGAEPEEAAQRGAPE
jgi:TRAP-type C4-dicarboxylate transport system permease small subunit